MVCAAAGSWSDVGVLDVAVKAGTKHFVAQRVTAVALVFLSLWFVASISGLVSLEYENVLAFLADSINGVLLALLCATLAYHSFLGVEVVIDDYVHAPVLRLYSLNLSRLAHVLIAVASVYAIVIIGFNA